MCCRALAQPAECVTSCAAAAAGGRVMEQPDLQGQKVAGYKGVYELVDARGKKSYVPRLTIAGNKKDLGSYGNVEEAARAYDICRLVRLPVA